MAYGDNAATVSVSATVLPNEIAKTLSGTVTMTPTDANDKWYYKLTSVSNSSTDLIAGTFIDTNVGIDDDTAHTSVSTSDKVRFLFIKNVDDSNSVYVTFDAGTASSSLAQAVTIGAGEVFFARLPNCTVAGIHAISSTSTVNCIVAAILDDVA